MLSLLFFDPIDFKREMMVEKEKVTHRKSGLIFFFQSRASKRRPGPIAPAWISFKEKTAHDGKHCLSVVDDGSA